MTWPRRWIWIFQGHQNPLHERERRFYPSCWMDQPKREGEDEGVAVGVAVVDAAVAAVEVGGIEEHFPLP